jgi:biofilm PGA synthesis N-glycosyltransferase PgaC
MEFITLIYLVLMFVALILLSFFILLAIKNNRNLFSYPPLTKYPVVSVLIPAYNEEDSIEDTINHVMRLDYPKKKLDVIAINDGSRDRTLEIIKKLAKKYKNLRILNKKNSGKADSLNKGIKISKGNLFAVVDSDSFPSRSSLRKIVGFFEDSCMGAVTSYVTIRNDKDNFFARIQAVEYMIMGWTRKLLDFVDSVFVTNGPLSLYRKEFVVKVGGFDPKTVTEDIDITWNLISHGYKTAMCLDASVSTITPTKFKPWYNQRVRWGQGGLQTIRKFKKSFFRRGKFGMFVIPFVSFSILMALFGIIFSSYLFFRFLLTQTFVAGYSFIAKAPIFQFQNVNLYPSVLIFYLVILFSLSFIYYSYALKKTKYLKIDSTRKFFNLLFYILVYLTLYNLIWIPSFWRFIKGVNRW